MKLRKGYVLSEIAGESVAIYVGDEAEYGLNGIVRLNKTGALMWKKLTEGCTKEELLKTLMDRFDVDASTATKDIEAFLDQLRGENIIEPE